ncbi:DUF192 domain-containing protein [Aggregatimonas sangjinii]|uniref:DUF192 domain-containing protein n=1 Tax=Aggregatimonas sangjinii TaxID=2583587 RepID=A0A5B7SVG2_9FLAO|nr:DUF192 domain-containing protein [Aggregatimonas sangjinii]QCX00911.1 DUF192 domain-containing protein [Aggregatimonas sangjinii]
MRNTSLFLAVFISIFALKGCKEEPKKTVKTPEVVFEKEGELSLLKQDSDSLIAKIDIEIAENEYETQTGLMYRKSMQADRGMLFIFEDERMHSFYMKNTQFPLDLIFIRSDTTIASIQENAQPFDESPLPSHVPVKYVLEVNAGLVKQWQLEVGDKIHFTQNK